MLPLLFAFPSIIVTCKWENIFLKYFTIQNLLHPPPQKKNMISFIGAHRTYISYICRK